ncbi:BCCT family transporter [Mobilicoccus caccae]|uniref:Multidrug DMT transporter permease n=1 Tax=Mobilicoccus caccae TaxID=1859295 RepID=A0ABQ6IWC2_9MICO|nr:BCCT family transporter [Mobilicoccus caccae]GMA42245.1 multidrug DMT transporter permease [Mobilicoccus caccae]
MLHKLHDRLGLRTSPTLFFGALGITLLFVVLTLLFADAMDATFSVASGWIITNLGWFYISGVTIFLLFLIYIAMSRFGRVRLSPRDEAPEHSFLAWFTMLFAAGIGTILMFWGVAEPISHFATPPMQDVEPGSVAAAEEAMAFTLYHFGLHTWTIFALPSLGFAYFIYQRNLPPRVSSIFYPLIGERIHSGLGRTIDLVAIVGSVFGVAVSIGLGTLQINSGLAAILGIEEGAMSQILIIAVVTVAAFISVSLGLDKGIKVLSNLNIGAAVLLLIFVLVFGPTLYLLKGTIESFGIYARSLPYLAFWNDTFANSGWQDGWTVFYWAWTITWSPFVGIFIAKISRGRSIRGFVFGVLAAPVLFSIIWYGIFGFASFNIEMNGGGGLVQRVVVDDDIPGALFAFLGHFPAATFMSVFAIALVATFFVTSMDSASLVMDEMASGHQDAHLSPMRQRGVWVVAIGAVAAVILTATGTKGLDALSQVITVVGLPFFVLGYFMMWALLRALREDAGELLPLQTKVWRRVLPPEEAERRRGGGEEAWSTPAVEHDPTYVTETGMVIGAPETAAYEREGVELRKASEIGGDAETAPRTGSTSSDEGTR